MTRHLTAIFERFYAFIVMRIQDFPHFYALAVPKPGILASSAADALERVEVSKISRASSPQACRLHWVAKKVLRVVVFGLDSSSLSASKEDPYPVPSSSALFTIVISNCDVYSAYGVFIIGILKSNATFARVSCIK